MYKSSLLLASICCMFSLNVNAAASFMGGEHIYIGNKLALKIDNDLPAQANLSFVLQNGAKLTYGEAIAMGDAYGIEKAPISQGATPIEREQRFVAAFNTMDLDVNAAAEIPKIISILNQEFTTVQDALTKGIPAHKAYRDASNETDRQLNCLTGGGCDPATWWMKFGRTMRLGSTNFDHFGDAAWLAYEAGHHMAMRMALHAKQSSDINYLHRAYAMNAFASHFLMDRYATGHMRTPRGAFVEHVTPASIGNVLMRYMHDEENAGLNVHNAAGQQWRATGDGYAFEKDAATQEKFVIDALQHSADEIYAVYQSGQIVENQEQQLAMLPNADETNGVCKNDVAQMFIWDALSGQLLRRDNLRDKHACKWTSSWWGWSTLLELKKIGQDDLSIAEQAQLAQTTYAMDAVKSGLINDKDIIGYVRSRR